MAVWAEEGRGGGLGRFARGWGVSRPAKPLRLSRPPGEGGSRPLGVSGGARLAQTLLPLAFPVLALGALAAQSALIALACLAGLAAINGFRERDLRRAARHAGLAGLAMLCAFALFGEAGAALVLVCWRFAAETAGLHRCLHRFGRAEGMLAGLGLWPLAIAGLAGGLLLADRPFAGQALAALMPTGPLLAWIALGAGAACAGVWMAAKIVAWRMEEAFTPRDAYLGLIGLAIPGLMTGPPDLAIGLCMMATVRAILYRMSLTPERRSAAREPQPGAQRAPPVVATIEAR